MIESTTSLRKISALRKKIRVVQGGQGSSKTYSILLILINHAFLKTNKNIVILSAELTKMRETVILDFVKIMTSLDLFQQNRFLNGTLYKFPNGSRMKFIGLDKEDVGKGLRSDVAYFNEVDKLNIETFRQVSSRAKVTYCDFNPDKEFFIHTEYINRDDCDYIILTFEDNELLSKEERDEILMYKQKGFDEEGNVINKYWANKWRVYGQGLIGQADGVVFEYYEEIDKIPEHADFLGYGVDYGFTNPTAIVAVYEDEHNYYVDEIFYKSKKKTKEVINYIKDTCDVDALFVCDSAEPDRIAAFQEELYYAVGVNKKKSVVYGLELILNKNLKVTKKSTNFIAEIKKFTWDLKGEDHLIDAFRYVIIHTNKEKRNGSYEHSYG